MPEDVKCPVRGHNHFLPVVPDPERYDLVIARCGDRVVYRASSAPPRANDAGLLDSMTVTQLRALPEWDDVPSPKPSVKSKIIKAILEVRKNAKPYEYEVRSYKE